MRYSKFIIASLVSILLFTSCEDFLKDKPESILAQVDFYTNATRIGTGVTGCYAGMKWPVYNEWQLTELRSDNTCVGIVSSGSVERTAYTNIAHFAIQSNEPVLTQYWYDTYQNISNVNGVLPSVLDNSYITNEVLRAEYEAELRFIRAYHYYTLTTLFGDVLKVTSVIGPLEAKKLERRPVAEIYNEIIIPDLKIAAEGATEEIGTGRITKWAAKALLAKAYMQIGGSENLALAKPLLYEVLNESPHGLQNNFMGIFDIGNEMNSEIIFAVRYRGGTYLDGSPFWNEFAPQYNESAVNIGKAEGNNNPTLELMDIMDADTSDSRRDSYGKYYRNPVEFLSYIRKYIDPNMSAEDNAENDWIVIRYADVELLYAEILAQDGNHATEELREVVNVVRRRAGRTEIAATFDSKEMALDSVYFERRLELAFENHRFFDLLRMNTSYGNPNKAMDIIKTHTFVTDWVAQYSLYEKVPVPQERNYTNEHLLLPIPLSEIDASDAMNSSDQNAGY
jgi:starch-binding outer membrane protein, SusD/RagB family